MQHRAHDPRAAAPAAADVTGFPLAVAPVIPVAEIPDAGSAVALARALRAGGISIIEVTLRTQAALEAIRVIGSEVPDMVVGAGTVCTPQDLAAASRAGARFAVSPASTPRLLDAFVDSGLPFLAGVATPSEMLALLNRDISTAKLFPASSVGGVELLAAVYGPLPQMRFCPTGGIGPENARDYLALPNVACVGGSWLTARPLVERRDWSTVKALASRAASLATPPSLSQDADPPAPAVATPR